MSHAFIASTEADAHAAAAVEQHHAALADALAVRVESVVVATTTGDARLVSDAQNDLVTWCAEELVPHAMAEETSLYPAAQAKPEGRLLVEGMLSEHEVLTGLVSALASATEPVRAAATATALRVMFDSHLAKENELVLPLLVAAEDVRVADLLRGMHEVLGATQHHAV